MKIIHAIKWPPAPFKLRVGREARSRCGKSASVSALVGLQCTMIDEAGSQFFGSTHFEIVTCKKCINLQTVGTIHDKSIRTADAAH